MGEFSILVVSSRKQLLLEWPSPAHSSGFRRCWKHSEECGASIAPVTQSKPLPSYNPPRRGPSTSPPPTTSPPSYYLLPSPPSSLSSSKTKPLWTEGALSVCSEGNLCLQPYLTVKLNLSRLSGTKVLFCDIFHLDLMCHSCLKWKTYWVFLNWHNISHHSGSYPQVKIQI